MLETAHGEHMLLCRASLLRAPQCCLDWRSLPELQSLVERAEFNSALAALKYLQLQLQLTASLLIIPDFASPIKLSYFS